MSTLVHRSIDGRELVAERRQQFVAAATELFGRNSYDATTMKEISKQAGFSSGLIYSYVETKEDILFLVLQNLLDSYHVEIPRSLENVSDPIERFSAAVRAYCQVVDVNADATLLAYRAVKSLCSERKGELMKMELATNSLVADCVQACVDAGYFRTLNVHLMAYQVVLVAHGWALKRWVLAKTVTLDEYVSEAVDSFLHAALTESGWKQWYGNKAEPVGREEGFFLRPDHG
ncbi:TetR/AcrR family transcriptional regulator [Geobacter argillaceus]|uniref:TetR family transcriptional regulator n=1 Tax=Geobacter argillaceus TaxID=345631 RepID=A0A562VHL7_9BACT|nr:TetR/AcrR family transcriptional regulator [Geobacter argillaceus]TWJ17362.1 TetR family transcriptional regulator [Geobacter argillaceus]